jgi:hypothetical protein
VVGVQVRAEEANAAIGEGHGIQFSLADIALNRLKAPIANIGTGDNYDLERVFR